MREKLNIQLSEFVDGELPEARQEMLLARLARDPDLKGTWQRYHMISASLRNQLPDQTDHRLVERISAAIEQDSPKVAARVSPEPRWSGVFKPLAGLAIAASVAVVAVLTAQYLQPSASVSNDTIVSSGPVSDPAGGYKWVDSGQRRTGVQAPVYLNQYLVNHNEYAASSGIRGMLPYVRIVGYDSGQ